MAKEGNSPQWDATRSLRDNPVWDPLLVDRAVENIAFKNRLKAEIEADEEKALQLAAWREGSEARIQEFTDWVKNYGETGQLPPELLDECQINWKKRTLLHPVKKGEKFPEEQENQLMYLEQQMTAPGVIAAVFSARNCGLGKLAEAAGVEDLRWVVFTNSEHYRTNQGNWKDILESSSKIVKLRGGWGSHTTVWEDLPAEIVKKEPKKKVKKKRPKVAEQEPEQNVVCIAFSTIPYGFSDFKNGTEEAWEEVEKKGVLTHEGIRFVNAAWEQAMGIRDKQGINVGHSFMGSEILHKPQHELDRESQSFIALSPAITGIKFGIGNFQLLGRISVLGGVLPARFQKLVEQPLKVLVKILTGHVDERVRRTHNAVASLAFKRGSLGKGMAQGIHYLAHDQKPVERRKWPDVKRLRVLLGSHDPLVDGGVHGELLDLGLADEQFAVYSLGHYSWCQTASKNFKEVKEAKAARKRLLNWIKEM
jgi:hypothetical protein